MSIIYVLTPYQKSLKIIETIKNKLKENNLTYKTSVSFSGRFAILIGRFPKLVTAPGFLSLGKTEHMEKEVPLIGDIYKDRDSSEIKVQIFGNKDENNLLCECISEANASLLQQNQEVTFVVTELIPEEVRQIFDTATPKLKV